MIVDAIAGIVATGTLVTVVLDGRTIDASQPARIAGGVTVAPLVPFVRDFADRIERSSDGSRVRIVRGERDVVVRIAAFPCSDSSDMRASFIVACVPLDTVEIPLAAVARALGASVSYDARARTLAIVLVPGPIATLTAVPYVRPAPGTVATFAPTSSPMPRPIVTGIPRPRRTPILVDSSPALER